MSKLKLSIAVGNYDRIRPLVDGDVLIDGVDPVFMLHDPEEIFFRAFRHADFDITELSMSSFTVKTAEGSSPYIGVPVFPSRAFRHTSIYIRTDKGINSPADLRGKRVGVPEYQLTANVWVRMILEEEYGVKPNEIEWVRGGYEDPGRVEKINLNLSDGVRVNNIPEGQTLSGMLASGEIDAVIGPRAPSCFVAGHPNVGYLFSDPMAEAKKWYEKTQLFPIMHVLGIRKTLVEEHPWLPFSVFKAFEKSKEVALERLSDTSATKVTLPFVEDQLRAAKTMMGEDFWSYGFDQNKYTLERFLAQHFSEGLSKRLVAPEELFHKSSMEGFKI
ncbi:MULTISPECIES: ABC transporter substrate-binding protein [unclassified Marinobacterium]|jgi:4,5-dihydroxyphthalate decarboxylase|uniref:ABC transporter substrate-binding protein n=1 Tax=unclassified Marinobacterium TaxID=2644139 RepID=UPI001569AED8|nr:MULTISPECIES: ABC transporter substrate-binding protein [unclassified Marinobacterium]NRP46590.1 4,5-dihydroxyphthalate decarboxylase [Marinobacterium sp. xm-d-543]NRQ01317.1 4,5-dihydroxyphthalate decarboxylase [Marinobacterium sp. xm-d-530]